MKRCLLFTDFVDAYRISLTYVHLNRTPYRNIIFTSDDVDMYLPRDQWR
jgi:hypothetical protein